MKKAPPPTGEYYPTLIVGACSKCKLVGTLEFPVEFDFRTGDRLMDRKVIRLWCDRCQQETEFIPRPDKAISGLPGLGQLKKIEERILGAHGIQTS